MNRSGGVPADTVSSAAADVSFRVDKMRLKTERLILLDRSEGMHNKGGGETAAKDKRNKAVQALANGGKQSKKAGKSGKELLSEMKKLQSQLVSSHRDRERAAT